MEQKAAVEIWDYLESITLKEGQNYYLQDIVDYLKISMDKAKEYIAMWTSHPRGEFIYYLTKDNADTSGHSV